MKKYLPLIICLFCSFISTDNFSAINNLVGGTWQMKIKNGYNCERWTKISNSEIKGTAFKVTGKDTTVLEHVSLTNKNGVIAYRVSNKENKDPVTFKLIASKNNQFIFSNPEHDFPQRVIYRFVRPDSINAWVDGKYKGKYEKIDFYYKRIR